MGNQNQSDEKKFEILVGNEWKALEEGQDTLGTAQFSAALAGENMDKNRYPDVLAPDETRVKLQQKAGASDYINANFLDGIHTNSKHCYIATQAPKAETVKDFWRMVWEQNVCILVMLTNLEEKGKTKANLYWPKSGSKNYGNITVNASETLMADNPDWCIRKFIVRCGGSGLKTATTMVNTGVGEQPMGQTIKVESRTVYQYHYKTWPDMGVPEIIPFLEMMASVNEAWVGLQKENSKEQNACPRIVENGHCQSPYLVHCSAGLGRTGAYCLIHTCMSKMQEEGTSVDNLGLQPILSEMRTQRPGLVQKKDQYIFCYRALNHVALGSQSNSTVQQPTKKPKKPGKKTAQSS